MVITTKVAFIMEMNQKYLNKFFLEIKEKLDIQGKQTALTILMIVKMCLIIHQSWLRKLKKRMKVDSLQNLKDILIR